MIAVVANTDSISEVLGISSSCLVKARRAPRLGRSATVRTTDESNHSSVSVTKSEPRAGRESLPEFLEGTVTDDAVCPIK